MNVREAGHEVAREFAHSTYAQVLAEVPPALYPYWAGTARQEFPGIPRDASFYAQSVEGLMMFFDCVASAHRPCALPSRAADTVWHAWIGMDEAGLQRFCIRHFGKTIPHVEKAKMREAMPGALAVCLVQARRRASQPVGGPHLPRLFTLDGRLGMPGGFGYGIVGGMIACSTLDGLGHPGSDMRFPRELSPQGLLDAGLIGKDDFRKATGIAAPEPLMTWSGIGGDPGPDGGSGDGDGVSGDGGSACGGGCGGGGGCGS